MKKRYIFLAGYLILSIINIGELNGMSRTNFEKIDQGAHQAHFDFTMSVIIGIFPGEIILAPFETNFYSYPLDYHYTPIPCKETDPIYIKVYCKEDFK